MTVSLAEICMNSTNILHLIKLITMRPFVLQVAYLVLLVKVC